MKKETYEKPTAELVEVDTKDIMVFSPGIELPDDEF